MTSYVGLQPSNPNLLAPRDYRLGGGNLGRPPIFEGKERRSQAIPPPLGNMHRHRYTPLQIYYLDYIYIKLCRSCFSMHAFLEEKLNNAASIL